MTPSHPALTPDDARRLAASFADALSNSASAYSPASLAEADSSLNGYHLLAANRILTPEWEADSHDLAVRIGCYLGEVIVRHLGGRWVPTTETDYARLSDAATYALVMELPNGGHCHPLARPFKLLAHGRESESLAGFYAGIASANRPSVQIDFPLPLVPPRRPWWRFWG